MASDDIKSYFGRYDRKHPARAEYIKALKIPESDTGYSSKFLKEELNSKGHPLLIEVQQHNYPKLYEALTEECEFRGIDRPACYIDTENKDYPLAYARADVESIFFTPETYESMNKGELRAAVAHEVKHLYSGIHNSNKEIRQIEKDCDRSSVESTNYKTVQSYVDKAMAIMVDKKVPIPAFGKFVQRFNKTFPNVIAENFWIPLDKEHPSPAARMKNMRNHEQNQKTGFEL